MYRFHPFFGADFFAMSPNTEFYLFYGFAFPNKNDINHQYLYLNTFSKYPAISFKVAVPLLKSPFASKA